MRKRKEEASEGGRQGLKGRRNRAKRGKEEIRRGRKRNAVEEEQDNRGEG